MRDLSKLIEDGALDLEETTTEEQVEGKNKISEENAQRQLDLFTDYYDICIADYDDAEEGKEGIKTLLNYALRAIREGRLEISFEDDHISVIQHLKFPFEAITKLSYKEVTTLSKSALDSKKIEGANARAAYLMGGLCGRLAIVQKLRGADEKLMTRIGLLFLA